MDKKRNGIKEINKVCELVLKLTDNDFAEMWEVVLQQMEYNNPLKTATTHWQYELSQHNKKVLEILQQLREVLHNGSSIQKP